ncbi:MULTISPECIES: serine hydrolase [unclassified Virgibacillus]|uniref:serine hydrolase domain-containing protein n=1 Tax=unclassified Virgibacillus TaxID=2620237 RepID=UPI00090B513D|nr:MULTISPECIES: serine hydrolase domain-containing protein [unclassified Virgibacillus]API91509.1 penicillin-binding protein [Virgibacillus sp. 6R]MBS7426982.1 beta-lactamase family protein [Virgibacillus sp. 19R1-5]
MESLLKTISFNGAVYYKKNGQIKQYYHGYQDISKQYLITKNTQFNLASLSKMYTAVMIFQLIEKGQLRLNDKITNWFNVPHFTNVTVAQLLTHTSGIPEYIAENSTISVETFAEIALPQHKPNEHWSYSNTNYVLLAKIIEEVSGLSYETYLQQYIARPLNLTNTTTQPKKQYKAQGHTYDYEEQRYKKENNDSYLNKNEKYNNEYGDGGIYATVSEVAKFLKAFLQGQYNSKEIVLSMITPTKLAEYYSYGFIIQDDWVGHTGGWFGCSAQAFINTSTKDIVVLATNQEVFPQYEQEIMNYLMGLQYSVEAPKHIEISPLSNKDDITGQYELADELGTRFAIIKDRQFMIAFEHQLCVQLFKIDESYYWVRNTMSYVDVKNQLFIDEGVEVPYQKVN